MKSMAADPHGADPGEEPENRSKKQKQRKTTAFVAFLVDFAGQRREEKEKTRQIRLFLAWSAARAPTRRQ